MAEFQKKLYPNCDSSIWLRSCEEEIDDPLEGKITGEIPLWLKGTLLRNGPGSLKVGSMRFQHIFDSSALLHRFAIHDGMVTYQCRFLRTNTLKKNRAANRIVVTEFGTKSVPDPCHTIFDRVAAIFKPGESLSDNAMISVYPFGDEIYAFTEGPVIHRHFPHIVEDNYGPFNARGPTRTWQDFNFTYGTHVLSGYDGGVAVDRCYSTVNNGVDPVTLDTMERKNMMDNLALVNHTSHPHVMPNGDVYNVGMSVVKGTLRHVVVKFPYTEKGDMFEKAHIVGSLKPRWPLHPAYMHTFGKGQYIKELVPIKPSDFMGVTENYFVIVEQPLTVSLLGVLHNKLSNEPLASSLIWYPKHETHIVLISRKDGKEHKRYRTSTMFFLHIINSYEQGGTLLLDLCCYKDAKALDAMYVKAIETMQSNADYAEWFRGKPKRLELPLGAPRLTWVEPRLLVDLGCETPRIHYDLHNGRPYRYFYAISSDVDSDNPGTMIKVDTITGDTKTWCSANCYPSEPIFVPTPNAKEEDDGVLLSSLVWGGSRDCEVALLMLDARSMKEIARAHFHTKSPAPKCLHGWYLPHNIK